MGNRLSKICTRTGDDGSTGLGDGARTGKDSLRIAALGDIDELNSLIGLLLAEPMPDHLAAMLTGIQHDLFDLGGEISIPAHTLLAAERVAWLEQMLDEFNASLPPLREFVLPTGTRAAALSHVARAVCRRAERSVVRLMRDEPVNESAIRYLNRLSDLLFVMARTFNRLAGQNDVLWSRER